MCDRLGGAARGFGPDLPLKGKLSVASLHYATLVERIQNMTAQELARLGL